MNNVIAKIQAHVQQLKQHIHEIPKSTLAKKETPEKWSKKEILGHLIDSARYNMARFTEIATQPNRIHRIRPYPQDALVRINQYQHTQTAELTILWQSLNTQICHILQAMPANTLQSTIKIKDKTYTLQWLIEDYEKHVAHHLAQILATAATPKFDINFHISPIAARERLSIEPDEFVEVLQYGELSIEYYQPNKIDKQQPHTRDEIYIILKGHGEFIREEELYQVKANDVLFVKAGETHRFINFSDDFATWVIFYGIDR